jgi:hypothetical protein
MKQTEAIWIAISALTWVIAQVEKEPQSYSRDEHLDEKREALKLLNDMVASMEAFTKVVAFVDPSAP